MAPKGGIRKRVLGQADDPPIPSDSASSTGPRGGVRRRVLAPPPADDAPDPDELPLTEAFKRDWGAGKLSSKRLQEYALRAARQGARGMDDLAAIGASGKHPQNCQRALMRLFGTPSGAPEFTWCAIRTKRGRTIHPFLLPHSWFASMHNECRDQFMSAIAGPPGGCDAFWKLMAGTDFFQKHPSLNPEHLSATIPIGFYGDAGAFSHQDSLMIFTWNSLLGVGSTAEKKFLMTCVKKSDIVPGTYDDILSLLSWSFNVMLGGVWPSVDWEGRELPPRPEYLAGGYRGSLCQVRGDWEFYATLFSFPKWNCADRMCWMCDASSSGRLAFSNCGPAAPWRDTRQTHESYIARLAADGKAVPVLFERVVGLRLECVFIDVLHTADLGFSAHVAGNIFDEVCRQHVFVDGTYEQNIAALNKELDIWYKANKVDSRIQGALTKDRIRTGSSWPKLKAKAAATRHVIPFCLLLAQKYLDRRRVALCQQLCAFYSLMDTQAMFLDDEAKGRLPVLGRQMCGIFASLSSSSLESGRKAWKMTPKVHLMLHLCEWQSQIMNPRFFWVYSDEDLVGKMVEVAESCHASTTAGTALAKWLVFAFEPVA